MHHPIILPLVLLSFLLTLPGCGRKTEPVEGAKTVRVTAVLPDLGAYGYPEGSSYSRLVVVATAPGKSSVTGSMDIPAGQSPGSVVGVGLNITEGWSCTASLELKVPTLGTGDLTAPAFAGSGKSTADARLSVPLGPLPCPVLHAGMKLREGAVYRNNGLAILSKDEYHMELPTWQAEATEGVPPGIWASFNPQGGLEAGEWHLAIYRDKSRRDSDFIEAGVRLLPGFPTYVYTDGDKVWTGSVDLTIGTSMLDVSEPYGFGVTTNPDGYPVLSWSRDGYAFTVVYRAPEEYPALKQRLTEVVYNEYTDESVKPGGTYLYWIQAGYGGRMLGPVRYHHPADGPGIPRGLDHE